ncbi:MAG: hypothetical protein J5780_03075 [Treponema sp.]|nr:hypothetical protein [Treponema sp.]
MKLISTLIFAPVSALLLFSCASDKVVPLPPENQEIPAAAEETVPVQEEIPEEASAVDDEYKRSVSEIDISPEQFELDKRIIMSKINELDLIMEGRDFKRWQTYVDQESINYWSKKANLQKASKRLPVKGMKLNSLEDYFKFVFIPARSGKRVDEIRYESLTHIKAVQVKDDGADSIYYNFEKIDGEWKVNIPPIEE